uniref:UV excision repair protein RAD23 n=1 Tax=Hirondellea gigas TaxID=1518452 RepID=A0A6A7FNN2_9CRUS
MVLLTLKNLQQQTFQVEIDVTASVKELKEKIEKDRGKDYPAIGQKLIYAGKILQDDNKLESYSMDVNKFLVIMVTKPKTSSPPPEPTAPPASTTAQSSSAAEAMDTTPATTSSTTTTASTDSSSSTTTTTTATGSSSTTDTTTTTSSSTTTTAASTEESDAGAAAVTAESLLVMGDEFNKMVENIMEMGYERRMVERALQASFNNPYTAVQYLVDGIPDNLGDTEPAVGGGGVVPAAEQGAGDDTAAGDMAGVLAAAAALSGEGGGDSSGNNTSGGNTAGGGGDDPLAFLRNQPQFVQMTQMMRTNPQLLDAFLQQIRTTNPSLLRAIQENQQAFISMINAPQTGSDSNTGGGAAPGSGGGGGGGGGGGRATTTIMLTQQDRDAIDRLRALGNFPEELVVQAYFACEKNENLAAEFLFSQAWD